MESQMVRPQGYGQEQDPLKVNDPNSAMEVGEPQEKKSVLKKVKAKAKKIKDTISKQGQSRGHNQDQDYQGRDRSGDRIPDDHDLDQEDDDDEEEDDDDQLVQKPEVHGAPMYESEKVATPMNTPLPTPNSNNNNKERVDPSWTFVPGTESNKVNLEGPLGLVEDPHGPHADHSPSNYETKVTHPNATGGEETGIAPILSSFEKIHLEDKSKPESNQTADSGSPIGTRSHDQFSPATQAKTHTTNLDTIAEPESTNPPSYTDKISSATTAITDKAMTTKNAVASRLGYGAESDDKSTVPVSTPSSDDPTNKPPSAVSSATSAITDRAITAKNTVASRLGYGAESDDKSTVPVSTPSSDDPTDKPPSAVSSATSAITDRAITAKNAVASRLGYGADSTPASDDTTTAKPASATATEYRKNIAATVYDKAAEIGNTVKAKMPGGGPAAASEETEGKVGGQDKGVSMRDYLAEKLRPGEDDKALSEAISDAVHKRKGENEDGSEKADPAAIGKVTESEGVKRSLGEDSGVDRGSGGYVEKVKGTFSSWLSFGDKSKTSSPKSPA